MLWFVQRMNRSRRWRDRVLALGVVCFVCTATVVMGASSASAANGVVVSNFTGRGINRPAGIVAGPDGALWFTNQDNNSIGRISTAGVVSNYTGVGIDDPFDIAVGSDGALWFTNSNNNSIGRITTTGKVTNYTDPSIGSPQHIAAGPDGALWFTNARSIGRITTAGVVSHFGSVGPVSITAGPDGALWFTEQFESIIGRITTTGIITTYQLPVAETPTDITAGPDGALWFISNEFQGSPSIGRITTNGTATDFTDPSLNPAFITAGPDGALWFTNAGSIGRITTAGVVSAYPDPSISLPLGITTGPDGALWFTNEDDNSIGRITPPLPVVVPSGGSMVKPTSGSASLQIKVTLSHPSTKSVTAQWDTAFVTGGSSIQAIPGTDYTPASGTVNFTPGQTTQTVPVTIAGGTLTDPYTVFVVSFHNPTNANMGGYWGLAFGFILGNSS